MTLQTQGQLLADLVEFAPDAMLIVNGDGKILYANPRVSDLFGCSREALVGHSVDELLPERFRARHAAHRRRFAEDRRTRPMGANLELWGRRWDGTEFPVEISLSPLQGGLAAAAIRDVTERKRVERELINARQLADSARIEADRANLAKSRFLATASHDLRQPLQVLSMLHGSLRRFEGDSVLGPVIAQQAQALDAMKRLLNALLDISKLESGAVKPQPCEFPLRTTFDQIRNEFSAVASAKGIQLTVDSSEFVTFTDPALLEQLLRNLVSNAIKYTSRGSVSVTVRERGNELTLDIRDTGIGIPADQLSSIFEEFFQVGVGRNTTRDGYGLGLAIVQRIARLLDLKVEVRSHLGDGSTFSIVVPKRDKATPIDTHAAAEGTSRAARGAQSGQILLTEDEPNVLLATRMLLELEGYQVIAATDVEEARQRAREHPHIDLLVSDYHLKEDETGLDVIGAVRTELQRHLPAILITGDTSSAVKKLPRDPSLRLASKPIDADELLALMTELLNRGAHAEHAPDG